MKWIKLFEDFKQNNEEGTLITQDDILKCIQNRGLIFATIVGDYPDNDPEVGLSPVDIDEDGKITVLVNGDEKTVDIENVEKIEF